MGGVGVDQICVSSLSRISVPGGDVMHAMKKGDKGFKDFGEAYFSWIEMGVVKAWKMHQKMTMNLVVPLGTVKFVFASTPEYPNFREEMIGDKYYARITVPPGIWFGFKGLSRPKSLVLNMADIQHDPSECLRKKADEIPYEWSDA